MSLTNMTPQEVPALNGDHDNIGIVFFNIGIFLIILGLFMFIPVAVDINSHNPDWRVFALCGGLVTAIGGLLYLANKRNYKSLSVKQGFLITTTTWVTIPLVGSLPFIFSDLDISFTDAFFEAISGVTTTGSTVLTGLDGMPPGILIWRSLLQWLGGVGIIVMGIAIMPLLKIGGMQLFRTEAFDVSENFIPRSTKLAASLSVLYVGLTTMCATTLMLAGMTPFEAICHALTTISTGGFSTSDASVGHFNSATIDYVISLFMVVGSIPFVLYLKLMHSGPKYVLCDQQVRGFLLVLISIIGPLSIYLYLNSDYDLSHSFRYVVFNVISVITGTGYASTDYTLWGNLSAGVFFFIMFIGGCSGSTSCGIKIFRFQIMIITIKNYLKKYFYPNGIFVSKYNNHKVTDTVSSSVFVFIFLFFMSFIFISLCLILLGLDFKTAVSGAGTALSNVGPGIGSVIGPAGNFETLPDAAKWVLSFAMLLGRLEILSVLVLMSARFWKN